MKNFIYITFFSAVLVTISFSQNVGDVWINEFSYNCADSSEELKQGDEFIEIVAPVGTDMSQYGVLFFFYSGEAYHAYYYSELSGTISSVNSSYNKGFLIVKTNLSYRLEKNNTIASGIVKQNLESHLEDESTPAGVLLVESATGIVLHGVLYEMTPNSLEPTEIVTEKHMEVPLPWSIELNLKQMDIIRLPLMDGSESGPNGSISMVGSGFSRIWAATTGDAPNISTPGAINYSQGALPVELTYFSATIISNGIKLGWRTETETNNFGFEVERKYLSQQYSQKNWEKIGFVEGNGNSNSQKNYSFVDDQVTLGKYSYRLKQIDNDGQIEYSKVIEVDLGTPKKYELSQNYPNPFNPNTTISFTLPQSSYVKLVVYNLLGQEIKRIYSGTKESGVHTYNFDAKDLNSGIYIYKLETENFTQTRKMTIIK